MKRFKLAVLACALALAPTTARADDGGWLDWLFRMDSKLWGVGTQFHVACVNNAHEIIRCEDFFKNFGRLLQRKPLEGPDFKTIKHEFDVRIGYYHTYGQVFGDDASDQRGFHAWKLAGLYHYYFNPSWAVGAGLGVLTFHPKGSPTFGRGVVTPLILIYSPPKAPVITFRLEESYLTNELSGARLGNRRTAFSNKGEWNGAFSVGFDLRRIAKPKR